MLELREKELGKEHPYTLASMNTLAVMLHRQDKYEEAEKIQQQTSKVYGEGALPWGL